MIKRLSLILITTISIGFVGCGNPPQPYRYKIPKKYSNITNYEKQQLLNIVIDRESRLKYKSSDGCVFVHSVWGSSTRYDHRMKNCFRIKNNYINRVDFSKCRTNYKVHKCNYIGSRVEKYANFLNKLQNDNILVDGLNNEINNYQKFKRLYNKANTARINKLAQIKISLQDNTKILPKQIIDKLRNSVKTIALRTPQPIDLYISYVAPKKGRNVADRFARSIFGDVLSKNFDKVFKDEILLSSDFLLKSYINTNQIGRYKVKYDRTSYVDRYDKFPTDIVYKINKVYFNYLPKKFVASDKNINVEVANEHSMKYFKIYNKTKEFIEVDMIAGYYNKDVVNLIEEPIKIPPMSYEFININYKGWLGRIEFNFPSSSKILVSKKNQKIKYGFSVGYKIINQNVIKNLYKVNNYSIKDFE